MEVRLVNNYRIICILLLSIYICFVNANASMDLNKGKQSDSKGYNLCQSDMETENLSDIYQEPDQKEDDNIPAEINKQPDENNDSETK
jgi:hypothetical protein